MIDTLIMYCKTVFMKVESRKEEMLRTYLQRLEAADRSRGKSKLVEIFSE